MEFVGILLLIFCHSKSKMTCFLFFDLSLLTTSQCMTKCYLSSHDCSFFITVSSDGLGQKPLHILINGLW